MKRKIDNCPKCGSRIVVDNTKRNRFFTVHYLACKQCRFKPENSKIITPLVNK